MELTGEVRIRQARIPDDAVKLAGIYVASAQVHAALDPEFYRVPNVGAVADRYRRSQGEVVFVAEVDGKIVGSAGARLLPASDEASMVAPVPTATIEVAVLPEYRSRGIGAKLMAAAEGWTRENGARRVQLDAAVVNERALSFYQRRGYQVFGVLLRRQLRI